MRCSPVLRPLLAYLMLLYIPTIRSFPVFFFYHDHSSNSSSSLMTPFTAFICLRFHNLSFSRSYTLLPALYPVLHPNENTCPWSGRYIPYRLFFLFLLSRRDLRSTSPSPHFPLPRPLPPHPLAHLDAPQWRGVRSRRPFYWQQ